MAHQVLKLLQQKPQQRSAIKIVEFDNLFNKSILLVTFETDGNYSIRFEMKQENPAIAD